MHNKPWGTRGMHNLLMHSNGVYVDMQTGGSVQHVGAYEILHLDKLNHSVTSENCHAISN